MHRGGCIFQYGHLFPKAEKSIARCARRYSSFVCIKARPEGGFVDPVSAIFWPFVEKIDSICRTGNLLHDVRCTPYESGLLKVPELIRSSRPAEPLVCVNRRLLYTRPLLRNVLSQR